MLIRLVVVAVFFVVSVVASRDGHLGMPQPTKIIPRREDWITKYARLKPRAASSGSQQVSNLNTPAETATDLLPTTESTTTSRKTPGTLPTTTTFPTDLLPPPTTTHSTATSSLSPTTTEQNPSTTHPATTTAQPTQTGGQPTALPDHNTSESGPSDYSSSVTEPSSVPSATTSSCDSPVECILLSALTSGSTEAHTSLVPSIPEPTATTTGTSNNMALSTTSKAGLSEPTAAISSGNGITYAPASGETQSASASGQGLQTASSGDAGAAWTTSDSSQPGASQTHSLSSRSVSYEAFVTSLTISSSTIVLTYSPTSDHFTETFTTTGGLGDIIISVIAGTATPTKISTAQNTDSVHVTSQPGGSMRTGLSSGSTTSTVAGSTIVPTTGASPQTGIASYTNGEPGRLLPLAIAIFLLCI